MGFVKAASVYLQAGDIIGVEAGGKEFIVVNLGKVLRYREPVYSYGLHVG